MIEDLLKSLIEETQANTAAQKENTAALLQVLAASGAPAPAAPTNVTPIAPVEEAPAAAPKKPGKAKATPAPAPEPEPTPEPAAEEPVEPEPTDDAPFNRDEVLLEISTSVKNWLKASGNKMIANRDLYAKMRDPFGVATASDLSDDKLPEFAKMVKKMIADNPV